MIPDSECVADNRAVGRREIVITTGINDPERETFVLYDPILPIFEIIEKHIVFPVQRKGEIYPVGGFLDIGKDRSPLAEVPFIPWDNEIIACVKQDIAGVGAEAESGIVALKKTAALVIHRWIKVVHNGVESILSDEITAIVRPPVQRSLQVDGIIIRPG